LQILIGRSEAFVARDTATDRLPKGQPVEEQAT
jgi:hypothetical protein